MADKEKGASALPGEDNAGDAQDGYNDETDLIMAKGVKRRVCELIMFVSFFVIVILHSFVSTSIYDHYETQQSVQQSFAQIQQNIRQTSNPSLDQFWVFMVALRLQILAPEPKSGFMKIMDSPDYVVTDINITTRRVKETTTAGYGDMKMWVSTTLNPFKDEFNEEFWDTTPIVVDAKGTTIEHSVEDTARQLGGFTFSILIDQSPSDFLDDIKWLQDPANGFFATNTLSVEGSIVFYNKFTKSFVFIDIQVQQTPSGLMDYKFLFNRPIGAAESESSSHMSLATMEFATVTLVGIFVVHEIFLLILIFKSYLEQKKMKAGILAKKDESDMAKKDPFEDHIDNILSTLPAAKNLINQNDDDKQEAGDEGGEDAKTKEKNQSLIKFYWDEKANKKIVENGPSLSNALMCMMRRDQRIVMYLSSILTIPIMISHMGYHQVYDAELDLKDLTFKDIIERDSEWHGSLTDIQLLNGFLKLEELSNMDMMLRAVLLLLIIFRMLTLLASVFDEIKSTLTMMSMIFDFLTSYLITLSFMFLAWSLCQHLLFGQDMLAYSTIPQAVINTILLALRDFDNLDKMFEVMPNITLLLFIGFIIVILLFLTNIFVSLVITVFNEVQKSNASANKRHKVDVLGGMHWTFSAKISFFGCIKSMKQSACCIACGKCCNSRANADDDQPDQEDKKIGQQQQKSKSVSIQEQKSGEKPKSSQKSVRINNTVTKRLICAPKNQDDDEPLDDISKDDDPEGEAVEHEQIDFTLLKKKNRKEFKAERKAKLNQLKQKGQPRNKAFQEMLNIKQPKNVLIDCVDTSDDEQYQQSAAQRKTTQQEEDFDEITQVDASVIPRRSVAVQPGDFDIDQRDIAYSDSDISMDEDYDKTEDMQLVKARQRKTQTGQSNDSNFSRTTEETKQLLLMRWNQSYDPFNLDADLTQDIRHTSNKQDAMMIKQREQRCGRVIWTTALTCFYVILYTYMLLSRYQINEIHIANDDLREIIWQHPFSNYEAVVAGPLEEKLYIDDSHSSAALFAWLKSLEDSIYTKLDISLNVDEDNPEANDEDATLYFIFDNKNYIISQGVTFCARLTATPIEFNSEEGIYEQSRIPIDTPIPYSDDLVSDYNLEALDGRGGHCFALFLHGDVNPAEQFRNAIQKSIDKEESVEVSELKIYLLTGEAVQSMVTETAIHYVKQEDGLTKITCVTQSRRYQIDIFTLGLFAAFIIFFLFNFYLFMSGEHEVYQRYKKWHSHNIMSLTKLEREQREKKRPEFCEVLGIIFRPASIAYILHVCVTLYTEFLYIQGFLNLTTLIDNLGAFPTKPIQANIFDKNQDQITSRESRQEYQLLLEEFTNDWLNAVLTYRRWAIFNLFLIVAQPLTSASQSMTFRAFLTALGRSFKMSLMLYIILFFFSVSLLFFGLHTFGSQSVHFKSFFWSTMTIFKMMVGRLVGFFYRIILRVDGTMAIVFTLPIVLVKSIFLTVFLAVIAFQYETEVLNKEFNSDINLMRSIFFCNISLDKRKRNKRTEQLRENEAMEKLGNNGGANDGENDNGGDDAEDEGNIKLGNGGGQDGAKTVNGGLEIYNKLDIKFAIQRKIPEWAMACADDIRQEVANRRRLRQEAIFLTKKLFNKGSEAGANTLKSKEKLIETQQRNSFNLMVARKDYITYIWFGIQFLYTQGELIQKVTESIENEIQTMLVPYVKGEQKIAMKAELEKIAKMTKAKKDEKYSKHTVMNPITKRQEEINMTHLAQETLDEQNKTQEDIKVYLDQLMAQLEVKMTSINQQYKIIQQQNKHFKLLKAFTTKDNLFKHNN